jgi:hypothetical protein
MRGYFLAVQETNHPGECEQTWAKEKVRPADMGYRTFQRGNSTREDVR